MKKFKTLGAISLALIGGATLVSVPLEITSCAKKHVPEPDAPDVPNYEEFSFSTPLNGATFEQGYDNTGDGNEKMNMNVSNAPTALVR
jgi:hypothetical protein